MPESEKKESEKNDKHPLKSLKWIMFALIAVGLTGQAFGSAWGIMAKLWPIWILLVLSIITLTLIKFGGEKIQKILANPFVSKLGKGLAIAGIIWIIATLLYSITANWFVANWGISKRSAWILLTAFLPFSVGGFWMIFKDILPGDPATIRKGFVSISIVTIGILAYSYYPNPNEFFDHKKGDVKFWVSDSEKKIYFSPGYGIEDGKKLRTGTAADARKYRKDPWKKLKKLFGSKKPRRAKKVTVAAVKVSQPQKWQLCWEKTPGYKSTTRTRNKCLRAKIKEKSKNYIVISYSFSGGKGIQTGTSKDGVAYSGIWRDSTGWGKWHLRFVSSDTAFGWSDKKGDGRRQPNVLERT